MDFAKILKEFPVIETQKNSFKEIKIGRCSCIIKILFK